MMVIVNTIIGWLILLAMIIVLTNNNIPLIFPLINNLLGGFKHLFFFHNIRDNPSHWILYVSEGFKPPTRYGGMYFSWWFLGWKHVFCWIFEGFARVLFFGVEDFEHVVGVFLFWLDGCFWVLCLFLLRFDWFVLRLAGYVFYFV